MLPSITDSIIITVSSTRPNIQRLRNIILITTSRFPFLYFIYSAVVKEVIYLTPTLMKNNATGLMFYFGYSGTINNLVNDFPLFYTALKDLVASKKVKELTKIDKIEIFCGIHIATLRYGIT